MPYNIEVMSLGQDLYPLLDRAANGLNGIQEQFRFEVTQPAQRPPGLGFQRKEYLSTDIWEFLNEQRAVGAPRPFIIAFVTQPLSSPRTSNLFGSHLGEFGLAAVTMSGAAQYVKEDERYCRYFLVRYALSFVNWLIKSHEDEARKDCYFHFKRNKRDILLSINGAGICDKCMTLLDNPPADSKVHRLTDSERDALVKMRQYVSGDYPYSIIMKGGGIKGLALAGALLELEKYFWFDRHIGTSAGAIAAVLLAANFKPSELRDLFATKDFTDFLDAPKWVLPFNLIFKQGLYPGEVFRLWIANLLTQKLGLMSEVRMEHLDRAVIYAARAGQGTLTYDSKGPRKETVASFAVRCSMSIPIFFTPTSVDGRRVFDGGLRNNFPLKKFLDTFPKAPFIALYLGKPDNRNNRWLSTDLLDIVVDGEERELVDSHPKDVVVIDTSPIGTVDFRLTPEEKDFLVTVGKASALELLLKRQIDGGPTLEQVQSVREEADCKRAAIIQQRMVRRATRRWVLGSVVAIALIILLVVEFVPF
jgi:predicted acylesterase/phospholipase RssA